MTAASVVTTAAALVRLDWESNHFGVRAARLTAAEATNDALASVLQGARRERVQLVVWPAAPGREVPRELLDAFGGALVDRKATFTRTLQDAAQLAAPPSTDPAVIAYPAPEASAALVELAVAAGAYSRFRVDAHIPPERFEAMYRLWIERSVAGELADVVLIVPFDDRPATEPLAGMIALSESNGVGTIGLVAVAEAARGQGIGTALVRAAHRWMRGRGAVHSRVVTQLANLPACRLYQRAGYQLTTVQPYFHFWL